MVKVGDTIHHFDQNRRVYTPPAPGGQFGSLIYAEHFTAHIIIGETPGAWIIDRAWSPKVGKRLVDKGPSSNWFSDDGKEAHLWVHEHRHRLVDLLRNCNDVSTLAQIAGLLGYKGGR